MENNPKGKNSLFASSFRNCNFYIFFLFLTIPLKFFFSSSKSVSQFSSSLLDNKITQSSIVCVKKRGYDLGLLRTVEFAFDGTDGLVFYGAFGTCKWET